MNKLPKEIYVDESSDEPHFFTNPEECAESGKTVTLAVYKLVGKVEVSTQIKQEVIVKKSPKKTTKPANESAPIDRSQLIDEMRVTN
jgi:hypothetical protein